MAQQRLNQKKPIAPTRSHPTKTSVKSPLHQEDDLQGAIGNRQMGLLIQENSQSHPSTVFPTNPSAMPMQGGSMPIGPGRIQRQPEFRGLSQELAAENATQALPATGALVQRKLTLGEPGDMYEQEADRVARQVVDEIHSTPFREQNAQSDEERNPAGGNAGRVQRQITVRSAGDAGGELSSEWEGQLQGAKSGGQPLSPSVKEPMERAFGADFGGVRVHTGAQADRLARSIQAKAFTTGQDVFFRQGAYEPGSRGGQELIAHELTHVVQQHEDKKTEEKTRGKTNEGIDKERGKTQDGRKGEGSLIIQRKFATAIKQDDYITSFRGWYNEQRKEDAIKVFTKEFHESQYHVLNIKEGGGEIDWDDWYKKRNEERSSEEIELADVAEGVMTGATIGSMATLALIGVSGRWEEYMTALIGLGINEGATLAVTFKKFITEIRKNGWNGAIIHTAALILGMCMRIAFMLFTLDAGLEDRYKPLHIEYTTNEGKTIYIAILGFLNFLMWVVIKVIEKLGIGESMVDNGREGAERVAEMQAKMLQGREVDQNLFQA